MRVEKEKRPAAGKQSGRALKSNKILPQTEWEDPRVFIAFYVWLALLVAYGCACFVRDMGWM